MTGPLGVLALVGRHPVADAELHGEPLWRHALRRLVAAATEVWVVAEDDVVDRAAPTGSDDAGVAWVPVGAWWCELRSGPPRGLLVHDPLCPLTATSFLVEVAHAGAVSGAAAAYRPVTDTVKNVASGRIVGTVDREELAALVSPVYAGSRVLRDAATDPEPPPLHDQAALVSWLRERARVDMVRAPSLARRVDDASAVALLASVDELAHRLRH